MLLYSDPVFLHHETGNHPECAARIRLIEPRLRQAGLLQQCTRPPWKPVTRSRLSQIHAPRYIDEIWAIAKSGGGDLDADTVLSPASFDVALSAAGAVCDATERVVQGEDRRALCLVRPPGHHAISTHAMGFCIFNNIAIAARAAVDSLGLDRVLIVDWDCHHGNGTQAAFWADPRVGFFSIHRWPFYPGTGAEDETGTGDGLGTTLNVPVAFGVSRQTYLAMFAGALEKMVAKMRPQLIFVSAGFDAHSLDPVGGLGLESEDFRPLTRRVIEAADAYAGGKVVSVLEGGYHPEAVAASVEVHLEELMRAPALAPATPPGSQPL
jgi:acetoin utilization deacetylase AcuC-like enzyme